jgi:hypothetical protein
MLRRTILAAGLAAALATPAIAQSRKTFPPCDVPKAMSRTQAVIDPVADLTRIIEKKGQHILAVRDYGKRPSVPSDDPTKPVCYAIVETDKGNSLFAFWYIEEDGKLYANAFAIDSLPATLPEDISLATVGPYRGDADVIVQTYAMVSVLGPDCLMRDKQWGEALRDRLAAAIPSDRPDLRASIDKGVTMAGKQLTGFFVRTTCEEEAGNDFEKRGDEVLAGTRSIWERAGR